VKAAVLVSRCLLGDACRWHGRPVRPSSFVRRWAKAHPTTTLVPVCPEELGGLPTPRPPVKRRRGRVFETCAEKANRKHVTGREVTEAFELGARITLEIGRAAGCRLAILCRWSPSCDPTGITGRLLREEGFEVIPTF
jgi:uncharacterized protein YbbK (DUF523 family)